jgi:hypothetical protein
MSSMVFIAALLLMFQAAQPVPEPGTPSAPGVYLRQDAKNWVSMPKAPYSQSKTKGLGTFVDTGGYTSLGGDSTIAGAKSSTRISDPAPQFFVREVGSAKDVVLVRLKTSGKNRSFHTSSVDATVENKQGFRKSDIQTTAVTEYPDKTYSVKSAQNLKPGEYLLVLGDIGASFDFGIDPKK